jgi:glycosyltransferase involved in cell wall biosynthesis
MKIVHVITALTKGGGEKVVVELANAAAMDGNEVTIVAAFPADPIFLQDQLHGSVSVIFISNSKSFSYVKQVSWILRNFSWLRTRDIIHCHLTYGAVFGSVVYLIKKFSNKKKPLLIETYHAVGMRIPRINRYIHSIFCSQRDAVIFMAEDDYWNSFRTKHTKIITTVIENGISIPKRVNNIAKLDDYKRKIGIPSSAKLIVGTVGMLRTDRQPWRYIPIFAEVARQCGPDVHFLIGGDGPEMGNVKQLIKKYNIERQVHLPGLVIDSAIAFSVIDIYISLSIGPLTGLSMMEAALFEIPVVGIQLFSGYNAKQGDWVWSSTEDNEIATEIKRLIDNEDERKKVADKQYQYVLNKHTTPVMASRYKEFYDKVLLKPGFKHSLKTPLHAVNSQ